MQPATGDPAAEAPFAGIDGGIVAGLEAAAIPESEHARCAPEPFGHAQAAPVTERTTAGFEPQRAIGADVQFGGLAGGAAGRVVAAGDAQAPGFTHSDRSQSKASPAASPSVEPRRPAASVTAAMPAMAAPAGTAKRIVVVVAK